jgi:RNA polymerase-binding transcription factor DksA
LTAPLRDDEVDAHDPRRDIELRELRERLCEERAELLWQRRARALQHGRARCHPAAPHGGPAHSARLASPSADAARSSRERLEAIERALDLLTQGAHGRCLECREPIPITALQADPARRTCARCGWRASRRTPARKLARSEEPLPPASPPDPADARPSGDARNERPTSSCSP